MKKYFANNISVGVQAVLTAILFITLSATLSYSADQGFVYLDLKEKREHLESLIKSRINAVVRVVVYNEAGDISDEGPGFFISSDGLIVTNYHIFTDAYSAGVIAVNKKFGTVIIEKMDADRDLALIKVNAVNAERLYLPQTVSMKDGATVYVTGIDRRLAKTFSAGIFKPKMTGNAKTGYFEIIKGVSVLTYPESRDGLVLDQSGRLTGLTRSAPGESSLFRTDAFSGSSDSFYAVDTESINSFLAATPEAPVELAPAGSRVFTTWLIVRIKSAFAAGFVFLYELGFPRLIAIVIGIIILLVFIEWTLTKLRRLRLFKKDGI